MKLIVASNRLPLSITRDNNSFKYKKSSGGLVTGIESLSKNLEFIWYGNISGIELSENDKKVIEKDCWNKFKSVPVFIDPEMNSLCYDGFCNAILWPTIHSFPDNVCFTYLEYDAYVKYNNIFANKILESAKDNDIVWIHDYHLMLVPKIIKNKNPNIKVMYFLHTAFPEYTNLKPLICIKELLEGIAASDVIGFHTPDYSVNFRCALNAYGIQSNAKIRSISIGIDPEMFREEVKKENVIKRINQIKEIYKNKKIVLGVDRTDYIKGMPQRFKGIERYFDRNPDQIDKTIFLQIAIPSRLSVIEYSSYVQQINQQIQEVNGKFGDINQTVIKMIFNSVDFSELCALYASADAILITSIIDGMNLVALEYIACQDENKGSVILSQFAGAMATIPSCIEHNANNTEEIAEAIEKALSLSNEEKNARFRINRENIDKFTSIGWAEQSLKIIDPSWKEVFGTKK